MLKRILTVLMLLTTSAALAQNEGPSAYAVDWYTVDAGGGFSSGGSFTVTGTIGQPDAAAGGATRGSFSVSGGFWAAQVEIDLLFTDGFEGL